MRAGSKDPPAPHPGGAPRPRGSPVGADPAGAHRRQAGLFVPARRARLPLAHGLFVSLIEHAVSDQTEGRLGAELRRIRRRFGVDRPQRLEPAVKAGTAGDRLES